MADFYLEVYTYGISKEGLDVGGLVQTSLVNAYTVSTKPDLLGFES
jgi:hypothetical protein